MTLTDFIDNLMKSIESIKVYMKEEFEEYF
jgi:hypothetical protein